MVGGSRVTPPAFSAKKADSMTRDGQHKALTSKFEEAAAPVV
jgi:hypothetical protein